MVQEGVADDETVESLAEGERKTDPKAVYDDIHSLPDWWESAIREFETRDLRVYQPPRFNDGTIVPSAVQDIEEEYQVTVRFMAIDPCYGDKWGLYVDGQRVKDVPHRRSPNGYSVYGIDSPELKSCVEEAVD